MARAYGYLAGRHKFGWAALNAWANQLPRTYFHGRPRILDLISKLRPGLPVYAEVNCPFAGLLFEIAERRHNDLDRTVALRKIKVLHSMGGVSKVLEIV